MVSQLSNIGILLVLLACFSLAPVSARLPDGPNSSEQIVLTELEGNRFIRAIEAITKSYPKCTDEGCDWIHIGKEHLFNVNVHADRSAPIVVKFMMQEVKGHEKHMFAFVYWPPERLYAGGFVEQVSGKAKGERLTTLKGDELKGSVLPLIRMLERIATDSYE